MTMELLLCRKVEPDLKTYTDIFNEVSNTKELDFSLVVKLIGKRDPKMVFHVFMFKEDNDKKMGLYLQEIVYTEDQQNAEIEEDVFYSELKGIPLQGPGLYAVEVVRNDEMEGEIDGPKVYWRKTYTSRITFTVKESG